MPTDRSVLACGNAIANQTYNFSGGTRMIPKYSVKRPYTVLVAVVLVIVLGVVSLTRMTTDLLPAMNLPYVIVVTTDVGASPEEVEKM